MTKKQIKNHLEVLISTVERDIVNMMVRIWYFQSEINNPIKMAKEKAQENLDIYSNRIEYLKVDLELYKNYEKQL